MDGRTLTFGISGYLYRSAVLYYDAETESFWLSTTGEAVAGPLVGRTLDWIPTEVTTWRDWQGRYPATTVLAPPGPLARYDLDPYGAYRRTDAVSFPLGGARVDPRYRHKDLVTIVRAGADARAYPHRALREGVTADGALRVVRRGDHIRVEDASGALVPSMQAYWFAWCVFYPDGTVYPD